jgi:hypothetical protein
MRRFLLNVFLVTAAMYLASLVGWIVPNLELHLPFDAGENKEIVVLAIGAVAFTVFDFLLDLLYAAFIVVTIGVGCLTLPVWLVASGGLTLYCVSAFGVLTAPIAPLWFLTLGFTLSLLGTLAKAMCSNNKAQ